MKGLVLAPPSRKIPPASKLLKGGGLVARFHKTGHVMNQGNSPHCVGYAIAALLQADPIAQNPIHPTEIYNEAKKIDGIPNVQGTTLEAGLDVIIKKRLVREAYFTNSARDVYELVSSVSPVVVGTVWMTNMDKTTSDGQARPFGSPDDFHAYLCYGVDKSLKRVYFLNSYGEKYGVNGKFWMTFTHFESIFSDGGTAFAIQEIRK